MPSRKYLLTKLPADTSIKRLVGAIRARSVCEQAHKQLKKALGLDHFEVGSKNGLHRHLAMPVIIQPSSGQSASSRPRLGENRQAAGSTMSALQR